MTTAVTVRALDRLAAARAFLMGRNMFVLAAGLIEELRLHIAPVALGAARGSSRAFRR